MVRSPKRYILAIVCSFIIIIILYTVISNLEIKDDDGGIRTSNLKEIHIAEIEDNLKLDILSLFDSDEQIKFAKNEEKFSEDFITDRREEKLKHRLHLSDYLSSPKIAPYDFGACRMSNCFNFSRCLSNSPIKVHISSSSKQFEEVKNKAPGESNLIHQKILDIIRNSKHYEPDPEKACIFIPEEDTLDRDPLSNSFQPDLYNLVDQNNNYGMNYLIFNLYSGSWPEYKEDDFAGLQFGAAIIAKASNSIQHHRPDFDIALPLFSYLHPTTDSNEEQEDDLFKDVNRTYLLTFKGKRYVFGRGSETRNSLYHLNNEKDIILITTCRHGKKWRESSDNRCAHDETKYEEYDFVSLMKKSIFCLTPRGRRLGSFRYLEALSHGCIPVVLSDGWIEPFDELIDWSCASIQIPEALLLQVPDMLRDIDLNRIRVLRRNCRNLYHKYFSSIKNIILTTLSIIEKRIENHLDR